MMQRRSYPVGLGSVAFALAWLSCLVASSFAEDAPAADGTPAALGGVRQFSLLDPQGQPHTERDWQKAKAVVLLFLATDCPISNGYAPLMSKLANEFGPRDVWFAGVYCDLDVTPAIAAKHAAEYRLPFTVLLDLKQVLARQTGVRVTPEAVVLLPNGEIVYRGRIDDLYATLGKRRQQPTTRELAAAIEAALEGKRPATTETKANGCPLPPLEEPKPATSR